MAFEGAITPGIGTVVGIAELAQLLGLETGGRGQSSPFVGGRPVSQQHIDPVTGLIRAGVTIARGVQGFLGEGDSGYSANYEANNPGVNRAFPQSPGIPQPRTQQPGGVNPYTEAALAIVGNLCAAGVIPPALCGNPDAALNYYYSYVAPSYAFEGGVGSGSGPPPAAPGFQPGVGGPVAPALRSSPGAGATGFDYYARRTLAMGADECASPCNCCYQRWECTCPG